MSYKIPSHFRMASYILFEHAAGYALFKNIAMEDIGSQLDQVLLQNRAYVPYVIHILSVQSLPIYHLLYVYVSYKLFSKRVELLFNFADFVKKKNCLNQ